MKKTNRCLVVHEDTRTGGIAGEIAAILCEKAFGDLDGPLLRVTALDTPVPYSPPLEEYFLPNAEKGFRRRKRAGEILAPRVKVLALRGEVDPKSIGASHMKLRNRFSRRSDMAVDIVMPQMGESIFEGTITKWLKKPGDKVERDEPLFEISTDKVDAEIPSPSAGVLKEIKVAEGKTVPIQTVVGVIDAAGGAVAAQPAASAPAPQAKSDGQARTGAAAAGHKRRPTG